MKSLLITTYCIAVWCFVASCSTDYSGTCFIRIGKSYVRRVGDYLTLVSGDGRTVDDLFTLTKDGTQYTIKGEEQGKLLRLDGPELKMCGSCKTGDCIHKWDIDKKQDSQEIYVLNAWIGWARSSCWRYFMWNGDSLLLKPSEWDYGKEQATSKAPKIEVVESGDAERLREEAEAQSLLPLSEVADGAKCKLKIWNSYIGVKDDGSFTVGSGIEPAVFVLKKADSKWILILNGAPLELDDNEWSSLKVDKITLRSESKAYQWFMMRIGNRLYLYDADSESEPVKTIEMSYGHLCQYKWGSHSDITIAAPHLLEIEIVKEQPVVVEESSSSQSEKEKVENLVVVQHSSVSSERVASKSVAVPSERSKRSSLEVGHIDSSPDIEVHTTVKAKSKESNSDASEASDSEQDKGHIVPDINPRTLVGSALGTGESSRPIVLAVEPIIKKEESSHVQSQEAEAFHTGRDSSQDLEVPVPVPITVEQVFGTTSDVILQTADGKYVYVEPGVSIVMVQSPLAATTFRCINDAGNENFLLECKDYELVVASGILTQVKIDIGKPRVFKWSLVEGFLKYKGEEFETKITVREPKGITASAVLYSDQPMVVTGGKIKVLDLLCIEGMDTIALCFSDGSQTKYLKVEEEVVAWQELVDVDSGMNWKMHFTINRISFTLEWEGKFLVQSGEGLALGEEAAATKWELVPMAKSTDLDASLLGEGISKFDLEHYLYWKHYLGEQSSESQSLSMHNTHLVTHAAAPTTHLCFRQGPKFLKAVVRSVKNFAAINDGRSLVTVSCKISNGYRMAVDVYCKTPEEIQEPQEITLQWDASGSLWRLSIAKEISMLSWSNSEIKPPASLDGLALGTLGYEDAKFCTGQSETMALIKEWSEGDGVVFTILFDVAKPSVQSLHEEPPYKVPSDVSSYKSLLLIASPLTVLVMWWLASGLAERSANNQVA